jgi:hypothetical protein
MENDSSDVDKYSNLTIVQSISVENKKMVLHKNTSKSLLESSNLAELLSPSGIKITNSSPKKSVKKKAGLHIIEIPVSALP